MIILGIESSSQPASVAIVKDDLTVAEYTVNFKLTHSQTLLPMLDEIVSRVDFDLSELDAIAVSAGPGSFTGLRIGAATAKGLGLALDKPLISVPSLAALAYNIYRADALICPMMDARRGQVYTGIYTFTDKLENLYPDCCIQLEEFTGVLNRYGKEVIFLGDGAYISEGILVQELTVPFSFAPAHVNRQRAASVASLGMEYFKEGKIVTAARFAPDYIRKSQAEQAFDEAVIDGRTDELKAGHILKEDTQ